MRWSSFAGAALASAFFIWCLGGPGCTLDFDRFEAQAAATTTAASGSGGSSGGATASSTASSGGASSSTSSGAGGAPSCDDQYGDVPDYGACLEDATTCEFAAAAQTESCAVMCEARGGECLEAFNDQGPCGHGTPLTCDTDAFARLICVCSRGCGGDPACGASQICMGGSCQ
jgi:hypothetical protein